ncbi:MAG: hypothetical protein ACTSSE_05045 [Candidatus Thorarchaeota archaeon]
MKEERFDELAQYGYIISMSLFIVFALAGWFLDNELLIWISVIPLLYLPVTVCAITIRETNKSRKRKKKKREKERYLRESKLLRCRSWASSSILVIISFNIVDFIPYSSGVDVCHSSVGQ